MLRFSLIAALTLWFCTIALADSPAKPKNPGPLDIPDSRVLTMSIDQYIDAYTKKHNGNITELENRTLCYYYAELSRDRNLRLARQLSPRRRKLVARCQSSLDNLSQACEEYQFSAGGGTIIYDFYAMLQVENEAAIRRLVGDLQNPGNLAYGTVLHDCQEASKNLQNSAEWLDDKSIPWAPSKSAGRSNYQSTKAELRK